MQVFTSFLKLGFHWTFPRDCTMGTSLGWTTREILEGFSSRVLSTAKSAPLWCCKAPNLRQLGTKFAEILVLLLQGVRHPLMLRLLPR